MCSDRGGALLTEDGGKQAGYYSWNPKQNIYFLSKPELLNFGTDVNKHRLTLDEKCVEEFFFCLFNFASV